MNDKNIIVNKPEPKPGILERGDLFAIAVGMVIGSGMVTLIGPAMAYTGYSVWLAYLTAIVMGFFMVFPYIILGGTMRVAGGPYSIVTNLSGVSTGGLVAYTKLVTPILNSSFALALGLYLNNLLPGITVKALAIAGEFIDREIGFSMATTFDPNQGMVTITGELYDKIVCLVIMISNLHYYILSAAAQSFELVPVGRIVLSPDVIYTSLIQFIVQMFMIGFRIAMPVFLGATMLNVILGVLAKSSPQMNMFAIGMQLKVFVGLFLLAVCIMFVPNIANYIMERMRDMIQTILGGL